MCDTLWVGVLSLALWPRRGTYYVLHCNEQTSSLLDHFVVVYLDDIVIYNKTLKEHVGHMCEVLRTLSANDLYVKKEKCSFAQEEVTFLGHVVSKGKLHMNLAKIKAIF